MIVDNRVRQLGGPSRESPKHCTRLSSTEMLMGAPWDVSRAVMLVIVPESCAKEVCGGLCQPSLVCREWFSISSKVARTPLFGLRAACKDG